MSGSDPWKATICSKTTSFASRYLRLSQPMKFSFALGEKSVNCGDELNIPQLVEKLLESFPSQGP
jgi:hypothetical protein